MSRDVQFKHYFQCISGVFKWEDPTMFEYIKTRLEGKRGYAIIEEAVADKTNKQLAYYFAGIIRQECLKSNDFAGFSEKDVHMYLMSMLRKHTMIVHIDDVDRMIEVIDDYHSWNKKDWAEFITEVIAFLQIHHGIHPQSPDDYKYNKYWMDIKVMGSDPPKEI